MPAAILAPPEKGLPGAPMQSFLAQAGASAGASVIEIEAGLDDKK